MSPKEIFSLCKNVELSILEYRGFMISPAGMAGELKVEEILTKVGLDKFFPNQLIVVRK